MKILGLDISTACTGYAVKEDGYIRVGHIKTPYKLKSFSALIYQAENIKKLIEEEKPDIIIMEDTYLKENFRTVKLMNMLRGYVYVYSVFKGIEVRPDYNTIHARSVLGLKGINKRGLTRKERNEKVMHFFLLSKIPRMSFVPHTNNHFATIQKTSFLKFGSWICFVPDEKLKCIKNRIINFVPSSNSII